MDKVTVYKDNAGEWRWKRQSENGEVVSTSSEGYVDKRYALLQAERLNDIVEIVVDE